MWTKQGTATSPELKSLMESVRGSHFFLYYFSIHEFSFDICSYVAVGFFFTAEKCMEIEKVFVFLWLSLGVHFGNLLATYIK